MKNRIMFRIIGCIALVAILVTSILVAGCKPAPVETIEITAVSFTSTSSVRTYQFTPLLDKINEKAQGELVIEFLGGPEVIGMFEQGQAVMDGVVDVSLTPVAFYQAAVPGADMMLTLSKLTSEQERESGFNDILEEMHEKAGLKYLGRASSAENATGVYMFTNVNAKRPQDLAGHIMCGCVFANQVVESLDMEIVDIPLTDLYTGMERGVIEGFTTYTNQVVAFSIYEQIDYVVDHPFYYTNNAMVMNLDKWNSLPEHLQELIQETIIEMEPVTTDIYWEAFEKDRATIFNAGVEPITFSQADADWYKSVAWNAKWDIESAKTPEVAAKFEQILKSYGVWDKPQ